MDGHVIINIPFPGFYESIYSGEVDNLEEQECNHFTRERQNEDGIPPELRLDESEFWDIFNECTDYQACYLSIAKAYVDAFNSAMEEHLELNLGLKFEKMDSPREYNFTTDRIFAYIPNASVQLLFERSAADDHLALRAMIKDRHTSYDGFYSYYDNRAEDWLKKPLEDWDHNELCTLLLTVMHLAKVTDEESKWEVYYLVCDGDGIYSEWSNSVDWPKFDQLVEEKRDEKREAFAAEHPTEPMPEPRCPCTIEMFR